MHSKWFNGRVKIDMKDKKYEQFSRNVLDRKYSSRGGANEPQKIIDYIVSQDNFDPLTKEQWRDLFSLCCSPAPLAKWIIGEHYDLAEEAIGLIIQLCDKNETYVKFMDDKKEVISYIYENAPEDDKKHILGTAFVLTCKNNNLYLIKWFLEQCVDVEYQYNGQTGMEAALSNIQVFDGIEDRNIVQYLEKNIHKQSCFDDVTKHYRRHFYEPPKEKVNKLLTDAAKERADFLLRDVPDLLEEGTSAEKLHQFMEEYNWGDGLEVPYFIMQHPNCELATALMIFWLAEGDYIFEDDFEEMYFIDEVEFKYFLRMLHDRVIQGVYPVGTQHYQIPLNEEQKEYLRNKNVDEVFLKDL